MLLLNCSSQSIACVLECGLAATNPQLNVGNMILAMTPAESAIQDARNTLEQSFGGLSFFSIGCNTLIADVVS
jgi:hypothetical protein